MDKPKSYHVRRPTDTGKSNGQINNPPRMPEMGGATGLNKGFKRDAYRIVKPGKR